MNKKQWIALLILYVGYLMFGASVFYFLENDEEILRRQKERDEYEEITDLIARKCLLNDSFLDLMEKYCEKPFRNESSLHPIRLWDFYNSIFFVITVVSTIGYGNLHPTTALSRVLMIFYAVIGIPLNGILLTSLAQFFSNVFIRAHKKYKRYESRFGLAVDILTYLVPGVLMFIFLPAAAFAYFEEWEYDEGVYYAFVTLTTIGFGDIVAGQNSKGKHSQDWILLYKILLLCWIIFGLGYLIMLLGFVTRAMRSKKMVQLEHKLVEALTHNKIWHGFSKDVGYLRRIMNELYLDKFKPVFRDEDYPSHKQLLQRSKSLPNISFGVEDESFLEEIQFYKRKRANSDYIPAKIGLNRVFSETDLHRIDRRATFATAALIQPAELLRHVVDAMGGSMPDQHLSRPDEPRGIDVFSDEEILKSEQWYGRKHSSVMSLQPPPYEDSLAPRQKRGRAFSECPIPQSNGYTVTANSNLGDKEWTWSGAAATKIYDIVNERHKRNLQQNEKNRNQNIAPSLIAGGKWFPRRKRKRYASESQDISSSKISVYPNGDVSPEGLKYSNNSLNVPVDLNQKRRSLQDGRLPQYRSDNHYMTHTAGTGAQGIGLMHGRQGLSRPERDLLQLYSSGDHLFSDGNRREILEETSLADFLRVLTSLHNRVGERLASEEFNKFPKRKMGTASMTPPKIDSLLNLFPPEPEPRSPTKRKFSLMPNIFLQSPRKTSLKNSAPSMTGLDGEEPGTSLENSNLKRLGRFLLRSYSLTPKTDSNPDVSLFQRDSYRLKNRKKFSLKPGGDSSSASTSRNELEITEPPCPIRIQIDSPESTIHASESLEPFPFVRSNTLDPTETSRFEGPRRGSSPASVIDLNPGFRDRFRSASSSESVLTPMSSRRFPLSPRFRPGLRHQQGESYSARPSLSDVKENISK